MTYRFHPAAEAEHYEIIEFYESRRPGLGGAYLHEFEQVLMHVDQDPLRYPIERQPNVRRVSLVRFPYSVLFRVIGDDIQILAIAHKRRRPRYWLRRS